MKTRRRTAASAPASGRRDWRGVRVFTIGHSTRSLDELVSALRTFGVSILVDVRTIPRSRHNPQFDSVALRSALRRRRLRYVHLPALGGLRHARKDSPNTGWRNLSFRGFADYMSTDEFAAGIAELRRLATEGTLALMCAEAVPWRCHRSLIADALTARGARVEHIIGAGRATPHQLTGFARVDGTRITYPGDPESSLVTRAPFHLEATVRVLQRRPSNLVDVWEGGCYRRVLWTADGLVLAEVTNHGTVDRPRLRLRVHGEAAGTATEPVTRVVRRILGLDLDPGPLLRLVQSEPALRAVALTLRGMRPPRFPTLFEAFANVIPFQQVSLDSGVAIVRRLVERFGRSMVHDGQRRHAFPTAAALAGAKPAAMRACGLSARKAEALRGVARLLESGELTEAELARLDAAQAIERLTELDGIGPWSAALVLLRGLGRLEVFPAGDVGVLRGLTRSLHLRPGPALDRVVRRFGDRRGYLYFCVLGGTLLDRGLIPPAEARAARPGRAAVVDGASLDVPRAR